MDTLNEYRRIIRELIEEYARLDPSTSRIRTDVVFDEVHDHYELLQSGWQGQHRVYGPVIHMAIRDGKVWIEHNGTEDPIATRLVEAGIPRDRIVLGFKPPEVRPHTGFATA